MNEWGRVVRVTVYRRDKGQKSEIRVKWEGQRRGGECEKDGERVMMET